MAQNDTGGAVARRRPGMARAWVTAVVLGLGIGAASGLVVIRGGRLGGDVHSGGWATDPRVGSIQAGLYTRASVAKAGLLALASSETVYYSRDRDDAGAPLRAECAYTIEGGPLPARWWSITLYAADDYLARNGDDAASMDATRVAAGEGERYSILIAPARGEAANWISSRNAGRFNLTLRLYNPHPDVLEDLTAPPLPSLRRTSCQKEGA